MALIIKSAVLLTLLRSLPFNDRIFSFRLGGRLRCFRGFGLDENRGVPISLVVVLVVVKWLYMYWLGSDRLDSFSRNVVEKFGKAHKLHIHINFELSSNLSYDWADINVYLV